MSEASRAAAGSIRDEAESRLPSAEDLVDALRKGSAYPHDPSATLGIQHLQTHLSHVFLTGSRVYKLRKRVHFDFADFTALPVRRADCLDEVRLNRRLSPDVYLGVAEIGGELPHAVGPVIDPDPAVLDRGEAELVTVMRRLPLDRDARSLLERDALPEGALLPVARQLADFHREYPVPGAASQRDWWETARRSVREVLSGFPPREASRGGDSGGDRLREIGRRLDQFESDHGQILRDRACRGRWVEGHGDLHLQHIWFDRDSSVRIIDCLEFSESLRRGDAAADLAFLTMDLRYRGRGDLAESVLDAYAERADDYGLFRVLRYYECYRALVRSKVGALAAADPAIPPPQREAARSSAQGHLALAERLLEPPGRGDVVALCGSIGTGKTTVAASLSKALGAVTISTDRVRKTLFELDGDQKEGSSWNRGPYDAAHRGSVYDALRTRAAEVVASGRVVILDAAHADPAQREATWAWARAQGIRPWLVWTTCPPELTRGRLVARKRAATDASRAGPEHLDESLRSFEDPDEWPRDRRIHLETGDGTRPADAALARLLAGRFG